MTISSLDDQKATDKVLTLIILPETLKKNLPYATGHNKSFSWSDPTTHALGSFYVFRQLDVLPYMTLGRSKNNFFDGNDKV